MKDNLTGFTMSALREEILSRMEALDTSSEEFTNEEYMSSFEKLIRRSQPRKAIEIMNRLFNNMPVHAEVGYRTEIGDKFREAILK